ncbi:hypothetical protein Y032_1163g3717 [Ancylostoma ceylanicum]|uniref:Uncharacterized protein n=1 Tax=Ancylostoma ceylanicum TaxID=53326 RepID=A0A016W682_9BILA|nr:hypothetical protein Y032_1163g3717 [Ancylostoma ceylanicum]
MRLAVLILFLVFCVASTMSEYCGKGKICFPPKTCINSQCVGRTFRYKSYITLVYTKAPKKFCLMQHRRSAPRHLYVV